MNGNRLYAIGGLVALVAVGVAIASFSGGDTGGRVGVTGTVTRAGTPLKIGKVQFRPGEATDGPVAWGNIEDGRFRIAPAEGPLPGLYNVTVVVGSPPSKEDLLKGKAANGLQGGAADQTVTVPGLVEIQERSNKNELRIDLPR